MINELFEEAILSSFMGLIIGVIDAWNKKVMFAIWLIVLIIFIPLNFYSGTPIYSEAYPWWRTIFGVFFVIMGIISGKIMYKETFKK